MPPQLDKQLSKVLAFPGWGTNAAIMKLQMSQLLPHFEPLFEIEFMDPTYPVSHDEVPEELNRFLSPDQKLYRWGDKFLDFQGDLQLIIQKIMRENIVGLIGFSQGTILSTMIGHLAMKVPTLREKLKFLVFFSGNGIKPPAEYYDQIKLITIPSFHTIQTRDWLQTETLMQTILFENPETVTVNQVHRIPILDDEKLKKLKKFLQQKLHKPKL